MNIHIGGKGAGGYALLLPSGTVVGKEPFILIC